jgi:hypothetical protein
MMVRLSRIVNMHFGTGALLLGLGAGGIFLGGCGSASHQASSPVKVTKHHVSSNPFASNSSIKTVHNSKPPEEQERAACYSDLYPWTIKLAEVNPNSNQGQNLYLLLTYKDDSSPSLSGEVGEVEQASAYADANLPNVGNAQATSDLVDGLQSWCRSDTYPPAKLIPVP